MLLESIWEGFWEVFSLIFGSFFEKRNFVKICIFLRKNQYFQGFEWQNSMRKWIKNQHQIPIRIFYHCFFDLGSKFNPFRQETPKIDPNIQPEPPRNHLSHKSLPKTAQEPAKELPKASPDLPKTLPRPILDYFFIQKRIQLSSLEFPVSRICQSLLSESLLHDFWSISTPKY